mgnify:CR=1 FL=1
MRVRLRHGLDADDIADGFFAGDRDLDARALELREELREGALLGDVNEDVLELFGERILRVVLDGGDLAAVEVDGVEGFQQILHLRALERQRDRLVAADLAFAFEVADAVFVHDDLADFQRLRRDGGVLGGRGESADGEQREGGERAFHHHSDQKIVSTSSSDAVRRRPVPN